MSGTLKFTGDDWDFSIVLNQNRVPLDVSGATSIKIQVVDENVGVPVVLIPSITASSTDPGADWASGVVTFSFSASSTAAITVNNAWLEIQKEEGSKKTTWPRTRFDIAIGTIE